tara:strand:- start:161 stop:1120 length:960 start_codon:yes stop_codon:yes gene_type:complete
MGDDYDNVSQSNVTSPDSINSTGDYVNNILSNFSGSIHTQGGDIIINFNEYLALKELLLSNYEKPISLNGYFPLFKKESMSNLASYLGGGPGTSHTHIFDDITYYMPDGLSFYHGDYLENEEKETLVEDKPETEPVSEPLPEPEPVPEPVSEPVPEPEPVTEPVPEPVVNPVSEPDNQEDLPEGDELYYSYLYSSPLKQFRMISGILSDFMSRKGTNLLLYVVSVYSNPTTDFYVKHLLKQDLLSSIHNPRTFYYVLAKHYLINFSRDSYMTDLTFLDYPENDDYVEINQILKSLEYNVSSRQKSFVKELHQYWLSKFL